MSNYENTGPGGVGKRYGALGLGGIAGITTDSAGQYLAVFEFGPAEASAAAAQEVELPSGFGLVTGAVVSVKEAFAAGTVTVNYDGSAILTAPIPLTAVGAIDGGLATAPTPIATGKVLKVVVAGITGVDGYVKVALPITRV